VEAPSRPEPPESRLGDSARPAEPSLLRIKPDSQRPSPSARTYPSGRATRSGVESVDWLIACGRSRRHDFELQRDTDFIHKEFGGCGVDGEGWRGRGGLAFRWASQARRPGRQAASS
jgi:hypothetical protein